MSVYDNIYCLRRYLFCVFSIIIYSATLITANSTDLAELRIREIESIVLIHIEEESASLKHRSYESTGFIVSTRGDVLTNSPFLRAWMNRPAAADGNRLSIVVSFKSRYDVVKSYAEVVTSRSDSDVVMLRLRDASRTYRPVPICYINTPAPGSRLYAMGFPMEQDLSLVEGSFESDAGPGGSWEVMAPINAGMNGAPVFDEKGFVVGIVERNVVSGTHISLVFPLRRVKSLIEDMTDSLPSCGSGLTAQASLDTINLGQFEQLYAESRALIIAASDYPGKPASVWPPLTPVVREAEDLRRELASEGFAVDVYPNPTGDGLYKRIKSFLNEGHSSKSRVLLYYLGHGWSDLSTNEGYIVPVDAPDPIEDRNAFDDGAVSMSEIAALVAEAHVLHTLFVFDSCFSGSIFYTRNPITQPSRLQLAEAMKPVREFITAGNEKQKVPEISDFTPAFIEGIHGAASAEGQIIGARQLGFWLSDRISRIGKQTPRVGTILDPKLDQGDFLFFNASK